MTCDYDVTYTVADFQSFGELTYIIHCVEIRSVEVAHLRLMKRISDISCAYYSAYFAAPILAPTLDNYEGILYR